MKSLATTIALLAIATLTSNASAQVTTTYKFGLGVRVVNNGQQTGLLVESVQPGGPADRGAVRVGDVLIKTNGRTFDGVYSVSQAIQRISSSVRITHGQPTVLLELIRHGRCLTVCVNPICVHVPPPTCETNPWRPVHPPVNPWQPVAPPTNPWIPITPVQPPCNGGGIGIGIGIGGGGGGVPTFQSL